MESANPLLIEIAEEEQQPGIQEAKEFLSNMNQDQLVFAKEFLNENVCFRCVFMLFRVTSLPLYRIHDFTPLYKHLDVQMPIEPRFLCSICQGVNQYCDTKEAVDKLVKEIKKQEFEFVDFKITFSISIVSYIKKIRVISEAEQKLGKHFTWSNKDIGKNALDFREVYKWIVSPKLARALDKPANLDGAFLINCIFKKKDTHSIAAVDHHLIESVVIEQIQRDLESLNITCDKSNQNKRYQKYKDKQKNKQNQDDGEKKSQMVVKGAEQIISIVSKLALPLLQSLSIFKQEIYNIDLQQLMAVECSHEPILLYGRYCKLSREVSQSPWTHGTKKIKCVEEEIYKDIIDVFGAEKAYLHAAGREDLDVRMLGKGRPFVMEFINPKKTQSCHARVGELEALMTSEDVVCHGFKIVDKQFFDSLKEIENSKAKAYCCVVWTKRRITKKDCEYLNSLTNLDIKQTTPVRVLHRRSLMVRDKLIFKMKAEYINPHYFVLHVLGSAGTYIKEFVHGDLGRTVPSIGSLLDSEADILQLDVTQVYEHSVSQLDLENPHLFDISVIDKKKSD